MLQNFVDKVGPAVSASFLNGLDALNQTIFGAATTKALARAALTSDAPLEVANGGSGSRTGFYPTSAAELAAGVTVNTVLQYGNVLRYGIVANDPTMAAANTAIARQLWNPNLATGPTGRFFYPNSTGDDIYYYSDIIGYRDGCYIDLNNCTVSFTKTAPDVTATDAGFFFAVRDFVLENGSIVVNYASAASNQGHVIVIGARADQLGPYFNNSYDSLMAVPQGNCRLSRLRIQTNNPAAISIVATGGLNGLAMEDLYIDGQAVNPGGFYYEFGWATSGTTNLRQTSHAHNIRARNIVVTNMGVSTPTFSTAFAANGAYSLSLDNLYANHCCATISFSSGESLYYRPWVGVDQTGAKRNIRCTNIVGEDLYGSGAVYAGAQSAAGGYLASLIAGLGHPADYVAETDLLDYTLDGFAFSQAAASPAAGYGVYLLGGKADIRNGTVNGGFQRGVVTTDEVVQFSFDNLNIFDNSQNGMVIGLGAAIWSPTRLKKGSVRNCYIAGSGVGATAGVYYAITVNQTIGMLIENCRSGYELAFAGKHETTQGGLVFINPNGPITSSNITLRGNHVGEVSGGVVAYNNHFDQGFTNNHSIEKPSGVTTVDGGFDGVLYSVQPTLTCGVPGNLAITYAVRSFDFIKRNGKVDYTFEITTSAFTYTTATGNLQITGLPINANNSVVGSLPVGSLTYQGITKAGYTQFNPVGSGGSAVLTIGCSGSGQTQVTLAITDLPTGGTVKLFGSGSYFT